MRILLNGPGFCPGPFEKQTVARAMRAGQPRCRLLRRNHEVLPFIGVRELGGVCERVVEGVESLVAGDRELEAASGQ